MLELNKIYCADCLELMKEMEDNSVDLVLTDPPYGIGAGDERTHNGWVDYGHNTWDISVPDKSYFDEMCRVSKNQIIWGGNYFTDYLYPSQGWLIWDKGQRSFSLADGEMAWTSFDVATRIKSYARAKALKDKKMHPTQKALEIIKWCVLLRSEEGQTIFDPFLGSGTTAVACINTGRNFIGIEKDKDYFEIAQKRVKEAQGQARLF